MTAGKPKDRNGGRRDSLFGAGEVRLSGRRRDLSEAELLSAASHDLRQPLHSMRLLIAALPQAGLPDSGKEIVGRLDDAVETLGRQLGDLLELSRLQAGAVQANVTVFSAERVFERIESTLALMGSEAAGPSRIVYRNLEIRSDPDLLATILQSFLSNALRHGAGHAVLIGGRRRGRSFRFEVWDRGPGLGADEIAETFETFHQIGPAERGPDRGLGLGLSIAWRLAELLGHEIDVFSRPGRATRFAVSVPLIE